MIEAIYGLALACGILLAVAGGLWLDLRKGTRDLKHWRGEAHELTSIIARQSRRIVDLEAKNAEYFTAEARRRSQIREAGRLGNAKQIMAAAQRRADAPDRAARTIADIKTAGLRPRDEVVAPVRARRAAHNNSGAGVAASKGG